MYKLTAIYRTLKRGEYETVRADSAFVESQNFGKDRHFTDEDNDRVNNYNQPDSKDNRREWRDYGDGLYVVRMGTSQRAAFTTVRQGVNAALLGKYAKKKRDPWARLCAVRLQLKLAAQTRTQARDFLRVTESEIRALDKILESYHLGLGALKEGAVELKKIWRPPVGWASNVLRQHICGVRLTDLSPIISAT